MPKFLEIFTSNSPKKEVLQHQQDQNNNNNSNPPRYHANQNDDDETVNNTPNQVTTDLTRRQRQQQRQQQIQDARREEHQKRYLAALQQYNLHARALFESCGFKCVPYCTADSRFNVGDNNAIPSSYNNNTNPTPASPVVTFFVGQLPLVPRVEEIALLFVAVCGVVPTRIWIPSGANTTQQGKRASPLVQVDVPAEFADRCVANLHLRVWFDQTCFYVAQTQEQIEFSYRYNKFLTSFPDLRFNDRPRSAITVVRSSSDDRANAKNAYNPLCGCNKCATFVSANTDYSFMENVYIPEVTAEVVGINNNNNNNNNADNNTPQWRNFDVDALLRTHAFLRPQDLCTPLERKHFAEVRADALFNCREKAINLWPFYKWKKYDTDVQDMSCNVEGNRRRLAQI